MFPNFHEVDSEFLVDDPLLCVKKTKLQTECKYFSGAHAYVYKSLRIGLEAKIVI